MAALKVDNVDGVEADDGHKQAHVGLREGLVTVRFSTAEGSGNEGGGGVSRFQGGEAMQFRCRLQIEAPGYLTKTANTLRSLPLPTPSSHRSADVAAVAEPRLALVKCLEEAVHRVRVRRLGLRETSPV